MGYQWAAFDMATGDAICDLVGIEPDWPLRQALSSINTISAKMHLDVAFPYHGEDIRDYGSYIVQTLDTVLKAVEPMTSWIVCYDDQSTATLAIEQLSGDNFPIVWCGFVTVSVVDADENFVSLTLTSAEGYFNRIPVIDTHYVKDTTRRHIARDLITTYITPYVPIVCGSLGDDALALTDDLYWQNTDNATVWTRLQQLIGHFGGEFRVWWTWRVGGGGIVGRFALDDLFNLGFYGPASGLEAPAVSFEYPGTLQKVTRTWDWSEDKGATEVEAYSQVNGTSTQYTNLLNPIKSANTRGRPRSVIRYTPGSNISTPSLRRFGNRALAVVRNGAKVYQLQIARDGLTARRYGHWFHLGDTVRVHVGAWDYDGRPVLGFPGGLDIDVIVLAHDCYDSYRVITVAEASLYTIDDGFTNSTGGSG